MNTARACTASTPIAWRLTRGTSAAVTEFEAGDQVFGVNPWNFGTHAEFVCMRESAALAHRPTGTSFEEAVAVCDGAILTLGCLRPADLRKG